MLLDETARQILIEQKSKLGSWETVAQKLSKEFGEPISVAAVWKMANGKSRSLRIMKALGLVEKRYRRSAGFECEEQLKQWDDFVKGKGVSLTMICRGLLDGTIELVFNDKQL